MPPVRIARPWAGEGAEFGVELPQIGRREEPRAAGSQWGAGQGIDRESARKNVDFHTAAISLTSFQMLYFKM